MSSEHKNVNGQNELVCTIVNDRDFVQILDSIPDMILIKGQHSRLIWANRAFRDYYGMSNTELRGLIDAPFNEPDYTQQYVKDDAYVFNSGKILDIPIEPVTRHDGLVRNFHTVKSPIFDIDGKVVMTIGVSRDVTENKKNKLLVEESLKKLKAVLSAIAVGIWDWDIKNDVLNWDDNLYRLYGIKREEFSGAFQAWESLVHPLDRERSLHELKQALSGIKNFDTQFRIVKPDQTVRHIGGKAFVERNEQGEPLRMMGVNWDITQVVDAQTELEKERDRFKIENEKFMSLVDNVPIMMSFFDERGEFEWCNRYWVEKLGWDVESSRGKNLLEEFYPDPVQRKKVLDFMLSGSDKWAEFNLKNKNGDYLYTKWFNVKLSNGKSIGIGRDVTEEKVASETIEAQKLQIVHSAKMTSLGEMASAISHEINNPLAIIQGRALQIKSEIGKKAPSVEQMNKYLDSIESTVNRISKIVKSLRTLSRDGDNDPFQKTVFRTILEDCLVLCEMRFKDKAIKVELQCSPDIQIECRFVQIAQIFVNLLNNAYDAIEGLDEKWVKIDVKDLGSTIAAHVTDSGHGIPENLHEKIMNPFFTTKEVGKGTGLGLSISRSILINHGGSIEIDTASEHTSFVITLPKKQ